MIHMNKMKEIQHPVWLLDAAIHDYHGWVLTARDKVLAVYGKIMPGAPVRHEWTEEVAFVFGGEFVYEIDGKKRVNVGPNDSILIPAGEEHSGKDERKEPVLRISVHPNRRMRE
jgi:mannose-6-phosphate isomerase-like protein (cupin superfamily)